MDSGQIFATLAFIGAIAGFLYGVVLARVVPGKSEEWLKYGLTYAAIGAVASAGAALLFGLIVGGIIIFILIAAFGGN